MKKIFCIISIFFLTLVACFSASCDKNKPTDSSSVSGFENVAGAEGNEIMTIGSGDAVFSYEYYYFFAVQYGDISSLESGDSFDDETVIAAVKLYKARASAARKAGVSFTDNELETLDKQAEQFIWNSYHNAETVKYGVETPEEFFKLYRGVDVAQFKAIYKELALYEKYIEKLISESDEPDESALKEYYDDHVSELRSVTVIFVYYSLADENGDMISDGEIESKALHAAERLAAVRSDADMSEFVLEESEADGAEENGGIYTYYKGDKIYTEFAPFCEKEDLRPGDRQVIRSESGIYALYCFYIDDFESESVKSAREGRGGFEKRC